MLVIAGCGGSTSTASAPTDRIKTLCENTTDGEYDCTCVADALVKIGYDTDAEISPLEAAVTTANDSGDLTVLPQPVLAALGSCRASQS
jgi:hypothetical protein